MLREHSFEITLTVAVTTVILAIVGAMFMDCQQDRAAREECMRNPMRSTADCTQAFPTAGGKR